MRNGRRLVCAFVCLLVIYCCLSAGAGALPLGRAYEMVSPVFKNGFGEELINAVAPDGKTVAFTSPGAFSGAAAGLQRMYYLAQRGATGWTTVPLMAPQSVVVAFEGDDISPSLGTMLDIGRPGATHENPLNEEKLLLHDTELPDTAAGWEQIFNLTTVEPDRGLNINEKGSDPSFCHILLTTQAALVSQAIGTSEELYDLNRGCDGESSSLKLVGVNNKAELMSTCHTGIGGEEYGVGQSAFNSVSAEGQEVFFTDCLNGEEGSGSLHQLYVRLADSRTIEVSRPLGPCSEVPCGGASTRASADFAGASEDGSKVYFTTTAQLTPEDTDTGSDLYLATIGCPQVKPVCSAAEREVTTVKQVSHDPSLGDAAQVAGVVRVAPDGSRVYFVASGDLLTASQQGTLEGEGKPVPHVMAENLYVYDVEETGHGG